VSKGSSLNSSERASRDLSALWPSYSQPEALLPTASNIFLHSPEITCCSCSSSNQASSTVPASSKCRLSQAMTTQKAGKIIIHRQHRCFGCACRDEVWSLACWSTLHRLILFYRHRLPTVLLDAVRDTTCICIHLMMLAGALFYTRSLRAIMAQSQR
jgi:hypothetical protein